MVYIIPKAGMHRVERYTVAGGLALFGLGLAAAAYLAGNAGFVIAALWVIGTLAVALNPADHLEYRMELDGLRVGKLFLPYVDMTGVRIARLDGTIVYRGVVFPGFWWGRAWSRRLGRFLMRGSTGLGQGVMVTMADGRRVVITPAHPVNTVVQLQTLLHGQRVQARRLHVVR
jgi:hypothetical protein